MYFVLLDKVFNQVRFLLPDLRLDIRHRRSVGVLCHFNKIVSNFDNPLRPLLPDPFVSSRITRHSHALNDLSFGVGRFKTFQFSRTFFLSVAKLWNSLPGYVA